VRPRTGLLCPRPLLLAGLSEMRPARATAAGACVERGGSDVLPLLRVPRSFGDFAGGICPLIQQEKARFERLDCVRSRLHTVDFLFAVDRSGSFLLWSVLG